MSDEEYMKIALSEAEAGAAAGEVPVGAVVVSPCGEILSRAGNRKEREKNPLRHAETVALSEAAARYGKYLTDCALYVTLEPCPMCAGAAVNARVGRLVFGAYDPKAGAAGSVLNVADNQRLNHRIETTGGVLREECAALLTRFFKARREEKK